jgi:hypothetical protein
VLQHEWIGDELGGDVGDVVFRERRCATRFQSERGIPLVNGYGPHKKFHAKAQRGRKGAKTN